MTARSSDRSPWPGPVLATLGRPPHDRSGNRERQDLKIWAIWPKTGSDVLRPMLSRSPVLEGVRDVRRTCASGGPSTHGRCEWNDPRRFPQPQRAACRERIAPTTADRRITPVKRPPFRPYERGMVVALSSLLEHWRNTVLLVKPETVLRWHREGFRLIWKHRSRSAKRSEARISEDTIALIRQMARDNRLWGAERIRGELLKLGIRVAKRTIQRHIRAVRPSGDGQRWRTFLRNHTGGPAIFCRCTMSGFGRCSRSS